MKYTTPYQIRKGRVAFLGSHNLPLIAIAALCSFLSHDGALDTWEDRSDQICKTEQVDCDEADGRVGSASRTRNHNPSMHPSVYPSIL